MTHFYFETTPSIKIKEYDKIKKLFIKKFENSDFIKNENYVLIIGDNIKENYEIVRNKTFLQFHTNKEMIPNFTGKKIPNRNDNQFCPLISFDIKNKLLEIFTDPFGLYYIYIATVNNKLILASHLKYILELNPVFLQKLDYDAIIEYLHSHTILEFKTLFYDIKLLPYNALLSFSLANSIDKEIIENNLLKRKIWYNFPTDYRENNNNYIEELSFLITDLINHFYSIKDIKLSFLLSGGLDSTLLISSVKEENKNRTRALTFDSKPKGSEIIRAKEVTEILGIKHIVELIEERDVVINCFEHLEINEGLSYNIASVLLKLLKNNLEKNHIYIDGFAGDTQFGGEFLHKLEKNTKLKMPKYKKLKNLMNQFNYSFPEKELFDIIDEEKENLDYIINKGFENHSNLMWNTKNEEIDLECLLFFTRIRLFTLGGPRTVMDFAPITMPYYHPKIFENYVKIKPKLRKRRKLEKNVLSKINYDLSKKMMTSKIWYNKFASSNLIKFGLKIARKLEGIVQKRIIPFYSTLPYDEWLRSKNNYYKFVIDLLEEDSLIWNILDRKATIRLFTNFMKRKNHHHKFIMHIIDLEITLRLFYYKTNITNNIKMISDCQKTTKRFQIKNK